MTQPDDDIWIPAEDDTLADDSPAVSVTALVEAGLPLEAGLRALSEEMPSARVRRSLIRMSNELASGESADEVLSRDGRGVPGYLRGLVRSGVQSGQLGKFLEEFLRTIRRRRTARQGFWLALLYPLLLVPLTLMVAGFALAWIVPQFKDLFNDFGVELPAVTILLINIGDLLARGLVLGSGVAGFVLLVVVILKVLPYLVGRALWTRGVQQIPLLGTPSRMRGMSEFCSLLGLLVSGNIPLPDALQMTAGALQDANLRSGSRKLADRVAGGQSMSEAASGLANFSAELRSLFHWEGRGPAFGEILRQAGVVYGARSRVGLGLIGLFFPPLLLMFVAGVAGLTIVALFMPLIMLINNLS